MTTPTTRAARFATIACILGALPLDGQVERFSISTFAGNRLTGDGGRAEQAYLASVEAIAIHKTGDIYIADKADHRIRRIRPTGIVETIAGTGTPGYAGDDGPATSALLRSPSGIAIDERGNLYIVDAGNARIRRISEHGIISTIAGGGTRVPSYFGARIQATDAKLASPRRIAIDASNRIAISDADRLLTITPDGMINHLAGSDKAGRPPDEVTAALGPLNEPGALAFDHLGALFVADSGNYAIRRILAGVMKRVSSTGTSTQTLSLAYVTGLAIDANGDLYLSEGRHRPTLRISPTGTVARLDPGGSDIAVERGRLLIADGLFVRAFESGRSIVLAGNGGYFLSGEGAPATTARFSQPSSMAVDRLGNVYLADTQNNRVRRIRSDGTVETFAGAPASDVVQAWRSPRLSAELKQPSAVAVAQDGSIWIADSVTVMRVRPDGFLEYPIPRGVLAAPAGFAFDVRGRIFISDSVANKIFRFSPEEGIVSVAGSGRAGYSGDGGAATSAELNRPMGVALDPAGNIYVCDSKNGKIRRIDTNGTIGTLPAPGLLEPVGITPSPDNGLYVSDIGRHQILSVHLNGIVSVLAGQGTQGYSGDDEAATNAFLNSPTGVIVVGESIIFSDTGNNIVRRLRRSEPPSTSVITQPIGATTIVSLANRRPTTVVPGALITILGAGLGPVQGVTGAVDQRGRLATSLSGTVVTFDGWPAPLVYVQEGEIRAQVPNAMHGRALARVEAWRNGARQAQLTVEVKDYDPQLFTTIGDGSFLLALNDDGSVNARANPARDGSIITCFATGTGLWSNELADGEISPKDGSFQPRQPVRVVSAVGVSEITWLGAAPGMIGMLQINVRVNGVGGERTPLALEVGGIRSETVYLFVR